MANGDVTEVAIHLDAGRSQSSNADGDRAQIVFGSLEAEGSFKRVQTVPMTLASPEPDKAFRFSGRIVCQASGRFGYAVRILPHHPDLGEPLDMRLVHWT